MTETVLIKMKNGSKEKHSPQIAAMNAHPGVNIKKEIQTKDGTTLAIEIDNEDLLNGFKKDSNVIIEKSQILKIAELPSSTIGSWWDSIKFFFSKKIELNRNSLNNFDFPKSNLNQYQLKINSINFNINPKLWNILDIRCAEAWRYGYDGAGVSIAVLDTGCNAHVDFGNNIQKGFNTVGPGNPTNDITDFQSHGSHVSSSAVAANPSNTIASIYGVAPKATIIPIKVLGDDGYGSIEDIIEGLSIARQLGVDVVNMSLGGGNYSQIFHEEIKALVESGTVIIAATGNESSNVGFPAKYPETIPVGSCNKNYKISYFSNYGPEMSMGLVAPGEQIYACYGTSQYSYKSGTSMATPLVAGAAVLLKQINKQKMTPDIIRKSLLEGAIELIGVDTTYQGNGKLDVPNSIIIANKTLEQMTPPPINEETNAPTHKSTFAKGCKGDLILECQKKLTKLNLYKDVLDGIYGNNTANAVMAYTNNIKDYIDIEVWESLLEKPYPDIFERSLQLTASFEGTGYTKIVGNFDGAVLTWGIIGFTLQHGSLAEVLKTIYITDITIFEEAFGSEYRTVTDNIADYIEWNGKLRYFLQWGKSIQDTNGRIKPFYLNGFKKLGQNKVVQEIQRKHAKEIYWNRASSLIDKFELKEELSKALCFDCAVQGFNKNGITMAENAIKKNNLITGNTLTEQEKRKIIASANANTCNPRWKDDVWSRKSLFINGIDRGSVHGRFYTLKNWGFEIV